MSRRANVQWAGGMDRSSFGLSYQLAASLALERGPRSSAIHSRLPAIPLRQDCPRGAPATVRGPISNFSPAFFFPASWGFEPRPSRASSPSTKRSVPGGPPRGRAGRRSSPFAVGVTLAAVGVTALSGRDPIRLSIRNPAPTAAFENGPSTHREASAARSRGAEDLGWRPRRRTARRCRPRRWRGRRAPRP